VKDPRTDFPIRVAPQANTGSRAVTYCNIARPVADYRVVMFYVISPCVWWRGSWCSWDCRWQHSSAAADKEQTASDQNDSHGITFQVARDTFAW